MYLSLAFRFHDFPDIYKMLEIHIHKKKSDCSTIAKLKGCKLKYLGETTKLKCIKIWYLSWTLKLNAAKSKNCLKNREM